MSPLQVVVDGTLQADGTLVLNERPNLPPGCVRVTMQAVAAPTGTEEDLMTRMERVWADQKARGHVSRTREEIDADLDATWGEVDEMPAGREPVRSLPNWRSSAKEVHGHSNRSVGLSFGSPFFGGSQR